MTLKLIGKTVIQETKNLTKRIICYVTNEESIYRMIIVRSNNSYNKKQETIEDLYDDLIIGSVRYNYIIKLNIYLDY